MTEPVRVTGLSYGPHAIARADGKVMFVRGGVPGDEVLLHVREDRRSYAYADVTSVVTASDDRRQPPCEYLPQCGGCPWQHIAYPAQVRAKAAIVREQIGRAITADDGAWRPILRSDEEFGYRHRLSLRVADGEVGFFAGGSHRLVPVQHCLLGEPVLDGAVALVGDWIRLLRSRIGRVAIYGAADGVRWVFAAEAEGKLASADSGTSRQFLAAHAAQMAGLVLRGKHASAHYGDDRCAMEIEPGLTLVVRAGTFTQVSRAGNRLLVRAVLDAGGFGRQDSVLDLFAGAGNLSFPIARRVARVVAVEQAGMAVEDGVAAALAGAIDNCEFHALPAATAVAELVNANARFDVAVLDPPRSGAAEVIPGLLRLAPGRVVYVSCDPATLARDLRALVPQYQVTSVQPIDLFPQTYHVETVVALVRR